MQMRDETPLVVIVGETASGKSALAMQLAQQHSGEIIAADSWTVYKHFDIGTAKPSATDRQLVRHHLLDIADPADGFSAANFRRKRDRQLMISMRVVACRLWLVVRDCI